MWPATAAAPTLNLTANGRTGFVSVQVNQPFTLAWNSQFVQTCAASGAWSGSKGSNGSQVMAGNSKAGKILTFTIRGDNAFGTTTKSIAVIVEASGIVNMRPDNWGHYYARHRREIDGTMERG